MSGVVFEKGRVFTPNAEPGHKVYGERLTRLRGQEYREWSARRSKLATYLVNRGSRFSPHPDDHWLYLGAANGTTVSHLSDLLPGGRIVAVEFASRPFGDLVALATRRSNIVPLLSDAGKPHTYAALFERPADVVYQDIAQRDQDRLFLLNVEALLKRGGIGFLAIKARSVDVAAAPTAIFKRIKQRMLDAGLAVEEAVVLDPWQKDHGMLVVRRP
jgi:fibrillarin-like pre-rRNA processing protein